MLRITFVPTYFKEGVLKGMVRFRTTRNASDSGQEFSCACMISNHSTGFTPAPGQGSLPRELGDGRTYSAVSNMLKSYFDALCQRDTYIWIDEPAQGSKRSDFVEDLISCDQDR